MCTYMEESVKKIIHLSCKFDLNTIAIDYLQVCMILEKININTCCQLSDRGLQTVAKRCPELRYLDMQNCHLISNVGVKEVVSRCVNLERLDVTGEFKDTLLSLFVLRAYILKIPNTFCTL